MFYRRLQRLRERERCEDMEMQEKNEECCEDRGYRCDGYVEGFFVSFTLFLNYLVTDNVFVGKSEGWGVRKGRDVARD